MKTIGLVGGMSWQSTLDYYRTINEYIQKELGTLYSGKIILSSMNFHDLERYQRDHNWDKASELILSEVKKLDSSGADFILICSNTGNQSVEFVQKRTNVPIIHIADTIGEAIKSNGLKNVGLLGTIHTMEGDYIINKLEEKYGLKVTVPNKESREIINNII